jgi:hypothetical protein
MISSIIKKREANGSALVTIPKAIASLIPPKVTHFLIFMDDNDEEIRPLSSQEVCDG